MLREVSTEQQPPRLAYIVAKFRRAIERQLAHDAVLVAGLERVARDPRLREIIKQISEES